MRPDVYTPTFRRALFNYVNNGFFARGLDADDHAFLEHVRECGSANGQVPSEYAFGGFSEEMDFWTHPFSTEPFPVQHEIFLRRSPFLSDEQRRAKQEKRARDKALMAAELEREQREWEQTQRERQAKLLQTILDDVEWEKANPRKPKSRFYVPEWKRTAQVHQFEDVKRAIRHIVIEAQQWLSLDMLAERTGCSDLNLVTRAVHQLKREAEKEEKDRQEAEEKARAHAQWLAAAKARAKEKEEQAAAATVTPAPQAAAPTVAPLAPQKPAEGKEERLKAKICVLIKTPGAGVWTIARLCLVLGARVELVSSIVADLIAEGKIRQATEADWTGGRRVRA